MSGDVSAPERIWLDAERWAVVGNDDHESVEGSGETAWVPAAAFDRVVAERDEEQRWRILAESRAADAETHRDVARERARANRARADRYRAALARYAEPGNWSGWEFLDATGDFGGGPARAVLAEGEQPAGETERTCPRCGSDDLGTMVYASGERAWCSTGCGWIASAGDEDPEDDGAVDELEHVGRMRQETLRDAQEHADRADRYREALEQANAMISWEWHKSARSVIVAALAEGEQPAGERVTIGEVERERIVEEARSRCEGVGSHEPDLQFFDAICEVLTENGHLHPTVGVPAAGVQGTTETGGSPLPASGSRYDEIVRLVEIELTHHEHAPLGPNAAAAVAYEVIRGELWSPSTTETATGGHDKGAGDALEFAAVVDEAIEALDVAETMENLAADGWALKRSVTPAASSESEGNE